jgi:hypothetical protein
VFGHVLASFVQDAEWIRESNVNQTENIGGIRKELGSTRFCYTIVAETKVHLSMPCSSYLENQDDIRDCK